MITERLIAHLKLREGVKYHSYYDTTGHLTGGVGHLLTHIEANAYPEGFSIPPYVVDEWFKKDLDTAYKAAKQQMKSLKTNSQELLEALVSVNYQLGTGWYKVHKRTWLLMKSGEYNEAAKEAADSLWYKQTPVRVRDFQAALIKEQGRETMKDKLMNLLRQKTTWLGIAALVVASLGLPSGSEEQIAILIAGLAGVFYPEKTK